MPGFHLRKYLIGSLLFPLLLSCSYPISRGIREEARKDVDFRTVLENPGAYKGSVVIWGGQIIQSLNHPDGTELIILEIPLDYSEHPERISNSQGRFIAKTKDFLDPAVYQAGRKVTVAGPIAGAETKTIGQVPYRYPVVSLLQIVLWRETAYAYPPDLAWWDIGPYDPFFWPWDEEWYGW